MSPDTSVSSWKNMALRSTILRCDIGSRGIGIATPDSDCDEKGVCIEDLSSFITASGFPFEQYQEKVKRGESEAYPTGLDLEIYSLQKFIHLALKGNPNIISMFFAKDYRVLDDRGEALIKLLPHLASAHAGDAFLGYMKGQKGKLLHRGRKEYVEKFGYDVKFAAHLIRIGYQGIEFLTTGALTLPITGGQQERLCAIRFGRVPLKDITDEAEDLERELHAAYEETELPPEPNYAYVDTWVRSMYYDVWRERVGHELLLTREEMGVDVPQTIH